MKIAVLTTDNRGPFGQLDRPAPWFGMAPEALLAGLAALPEMEIHVLSCIRRPVKSPAQLADNVWFHSLHVPRLGWIRTGYAGCLRAVRRRLQRLQPDLVHGHGSETEGALCAAFSGFPNVVTLLGIMREMARVTRARPGSFFWVSALLESLALRRTAGVLANSRFTEEKVRGRTPRTWVVPNAVREVFFTRPRATAIAGEATPRREPLLLNIGTVCEYKRQNELLELAEQLHAEGLKFHLQFIGPAPRGGPYGERFLERSRGRPFISHQAFLPVAELIDRYDGASALVHVSAVESFGLVVAEALARNLKFLGFNSGGVADIVAGVEEADSFADGDWAGLIDALRRWLRAGAPPPAPAAALMRQRYHPLVVARQHLEVYREVLGQWGRR